MSSLLGRIDEFDATIWSSGPNMSKGLTTLWDRRCWHETSGTFGGGSTGYLHVTSFLCLPISMETRRTQK